MANFISVFQGKYDVEECGLKKKTKQEYNYW